MLDEKLLEDAMRLSGERTCSATVNLALSELVRRIRAGKILLLQGSGAWEGDLSAMRGGVVRDRLPTKKRRGPR